MTIFRGGVLLPWSCVCVLRSLGHWSSVKQAKSFVVTYISMDPRKTGKLSSVGRDPFGGGGSFVLISKLDTKIILVDWDE